MDKSLKRRSFLTTAGVVGAGALGGCLGSIPGLGGGSNDDGGSSGAQQWPMPRGTAGNTGRSSSGGPGTDASLSFEASLRNGSRQQGWRAPIVGNDGVYAVAMGSEGPPPNPPKQFLYAYRLSRSDGSETWRKAIVEGQDIGLVQSYASPVLSEESVYVVWSDADYVKHLTAISRSDGTTDWSVTFDGGSNATEARSPIVDGDTVYCFAEGSVVALSTADGSRQWRSPRIPIAQSIPSVGDRGIAVYRDAESVRDPSKLALFDPEDGTERWSKVYGNTTNPLPTVAGDTVFLAENDLGSSPSADDHPPRKIRAISVEDGSQRWEHVYDTEAIEDSFAWGGTSTVAVTGDRVYYALGFANRTELPSSGNLSEAEREEFQERLYEGPNVVALNRSDGSVAWRTQVGTQARIFRPLVVGPDRLYAQYRGEPQDDSKQYRIRTFVVDRESGDVLGEIDGIDGLYPLSIADGTLYETGSGTVRAWE